MFCHKKFTNPKSILSAQKKKTKPNDLSAVNIIVKAIKNEPDRIWTLKEIHGKYLEVGGTDTHRSRFLAKITDELKSDIYVFKSIGLSPLLMHKKKASSMFAIVDSQEDEYCDYSDVLRVATKIKEEIKAITPNKSHYTPVTKENLNLSCVKTLQILLNGISLNLMIPCQHPWLGILCKACRLAFLHI